MPRTLLLADDSITIQKMVAITFQNEDFAVTAVDNGEDALAKAREIKPDIILADVVMPRRNGYELCQAIKADPTLRSIPVLLLAGTFEAFDEGKAVAAQANGHIVKPFDSQALLDRVTALVTGQALPASAATQPVPPRPVAPMAPAAPAAPPAFAMPRPPMAPGFATGIPPQRSPSMAPPPPPTPGAALPPLFRPPQAQPPAVAAPARPPAPFMPGAGLPPLQPIPLTQPAHPVVSQTAPTRPPFVGTPTPMLIPGGLPPIGSPAGPGLPRSGFSPPPAGSLNVPPPGISIGRPATRPPTPAPVQPRPMSLTPAPWAVSSSPVVPPRAPVPPAPAAVPRSATVAWSTDLGIPAAPAAPVAQRSKPTPTPMWGVAVGRPDPAGFGKAPSPAARPPASNIVVDPGLSSSPTDLSLDVAMDEEASKGALELPLDDTPLELEPASAPTFNQASIRASASAQLDISEEDGPEDRIRTSSLADLAQGGSRAAPVGEIEIDGDGSPGDEIELASAHEFLPGAPKSAPVPRPVAAKHPPARPAAASPASDGGEGALRAALSEASREVIEKIAWEVVPQLAEVIIREHVERLARERSPK